MAPLGLVPRDSGLRLGANKSLALRVLRILSFSTRPPSTSSQITAAEGIDNLETTCGKGILKSKHSSALQKIYTKAVLQLREEWQSEGNDHSYFGEPLQGGCRSLSDKRPKMASQSRKDCPQASVPSFPTLVSFLRFLSISWLAFPGTAIFPHLFSNSQLIGSLVVAQEMRRDISVSLTSHICSPPEFD